ncbi:MAG: hypothetical protein KAV18_00760 [Candidatus Omnitrophica bacterium]|nr:hypothetical protein [Candidatus Omnitrophota bacterium]MCK4422583.1 hypothetical protein [Candidatus Omnitrophota bacterium]
MVREKDKKKWVVNKASSFEEAEAWDDEYQANLSQEERLSNIQICRDNYYKVIGINAPRKRLSRVFRVVKQVSR